jgi:hypothetical protein
LSNITTSIALASPVSQRSPDGYIFPRHELRKLKGGNILELYDAELLRQVTSWQYAWRTTQKAANVIYRWHDMRHTFITRPGTWLRTEG